MSLSALRNFSVARDARGVVTVVLDVPGKPVNVLSEQVLAELQRIVDELEHDATARLVLFRSGTPSGFIAGGDLREVQAIRSAATMDHLITIGQKVFDRLENLSLPTVAAIRGICVGGGLELALACRYRLAADDDRTQFAMPEVALGLSPAWGGTQRLPERIGLAAALAMLLDGVKLSARQALAAGLVDAVWPAEQFSDGVEQFIGDRLAERPFRPRHRGPWTRFDDRTRLARPTLLEAARRRIASRPADRASLDAILSAVEEGLSRGRQAGLARERQVFPDLLFSPNCRQRLAQFFQRRAHKAREVTPNPWVDRLTIGAVLRETARKFGAREAVIFPQAGVRWTWAQFDEEVDRVARALLALEFRRGDRFGVWSTNWPQWVVLQFATARIGVVLVTINPAYRAAELEYAIGQSEIRGLALGERFRKASCFETLAEVCPELNASAPGQLHSAKCPHLRWAICLRGAEHPGMLAWEELQHAGERVLPGRLEEAERELMPADPINLQYTSGTTGWPKGVVLSHRNLVLNAFYAGDCQRLDERDRICIPVPLYHCFGCVLGTMCAVVRGAAMVFPHESFEVEATLASIEAEHCTAIYGVPTMFIVELERLGSAPRDTSSLRTGIMAGSPCPIEVMKRVVSELGAREIIIAYGQTESSPLVTTTRTDDPLDKRVGTIGRPLPGVEVKIQDLLTGQELSDGVAGEICCRGHNVMLGYHDLPEATAQAIDAGGWLHTGDVGLRQPDGYFRITGRIKEMIVRGGENIAPREIEELLYQHPLIEQVAIVGVPDLKFGEEALAWIKLRRGATATADEIRAFCRARLAHFKTPRYIKFVESFPTTVSGKVQKYKIRQQAIEELGLHDAAAVETA